MKNYQQSEKLPAENKKTKNEIVKKKEQDIDEKSKKLKESMTPKEKRTIELAEEKGSFQLVKCTFFTRPWFHIKQK